MEDLDLIPVRPVGYKPEGLVNDPLADIAAAEEEEREEREQEEMLARGRKNRRGRRSL